MLLGEPRVLVLGSASLSLLVWATRTVLLGTVRRSAIGKVGAGGRGAIERKPGWALPLAGGKQSEGSEAPHQLSCSEPPRALKHKRCRWEALPGSAASRASYRTATAFSLFTLPSPSVDLDSFSSLRMLFHIVSSRGQKTKALREKFVSTYVWQVLKLIRIFLFCFKF